MADSALRAIEDQPYFHYWGDHPGWLIVVGQTRDSDCLERSNFRVIYAALSEHFGDDITIERCSHWLCGWVEHVLVNPYNRDAVAAAEAWRARLADYPVASDDDLSDLEWEEACDTMEGVARHDALASGHSEPPELWESDNDGTYYYTCTRCQQDVTVSYDGNSWHVPASCVGDDDEGADSCLLH